MTEKDPAAAEIDRAQVVFHPPFLLLAAILIGFGLRALWPAMFLPPGWAAIAGPIVVATALGIFGWSVVTMHRGGASVPTNTPTAALVRQGPYALSRNPIYFGMVTLVLGMALWADSLWFAGLGVVMVVLLSWGVITREERYLEHKFGERYVTYKECVRRWL